jgi:hypothetical protein
MADKGDMSVRQAGQRGGERTRETHDKKFYHDIGQEGGRKGGQRVKDLVDKGKSVENQ